MGEGTTAAAGQQGCRLHGLGCRKLRVCLLCQVVARRCLRTSLCCALSALFLRAQAYFKMNNVLIDDRRIKVDFSQVC